MKQFHAFSLLNELLGFFADLKAKALFKTDGPKSARGIFHEAEAVEDAHDVIFEIPPASKKIQQFAGRFINPNGHGIDGR